MRSMAFSLIVCVALLAGCGSSTSNPALEHPSEDTEGARRVTLYTSVDDAFAKMVVKRFEEETGITVDLLGDTEATALVEAIQQALS